MEDRLPAKQFAEAERGVELMRKYLDRFWDQALAAFKDAAEERET